MVAEQPSVHAFDPAAALDTARSVVVEACAGSGKTWLLSSRVARALVEGVAPRSILALTFTEKAAAEMRNRVIGHLKEMATMTEHDMRAKLKGWGLSGAALEQAMARAPQAYRTFLMDPHPPVISTFHSWYIRLAAMAPVKVAGWATMGLSQRSWDLQRQAWQLFYAEEVDALPYARLVALLGPANTRKAMDDWMRARVEWRAFAHGIGASRTSAAQAAAALDKADADNQADITQFYQAQADRAKRLAAAYAQVEKREEFCSLLSRWSSGDLASLTSVFLTALKSEDQWKTDTPRRFQLKGGDDKFVRKEKDLKVWGAQGSALKDDVAELGRALIDLLDRCDQRTADARTQALWVCSEALARCAERIMARGHETDFSGLELKAWDLLGGELASAFHARLDTQISHVLVDEFQDTNPVQWAMLKRWLSEYLQDDDRVRASAPKVFIVGDPKQSIYRFRRADPQVFRLASQWLADHYGAAVHQGNTTRRCGQPIAEFLNAVMPALDVGQRFAPHATSASDHTGFVKRLALSETWEEEGERIATALHAVRGRFPDIAWSDIRILVRTRTHMQAYEAALTRAAIPFIGDRVGGLLNEPEVLDLMALLRFLAFPWSDSDLAQTLKSPLFGVSDAQLAAVAVCGAPTVAPGPSAPTLYARLRDITHRADSDPDLVRAYTTLTEWMHWSTQLPVHDLLDRILYAQEALDRFAARFGGRQGLQCLANIEAFVALALDLDTGRLPSLPRFLQELGRWSQANTNDTPSPGAMPASDAVVLSTLHGAKGLEAKVVVLAGLMDKETGDSGLRWLMQWNPDRDGLLGVTTWRSGDPFNPLVEAALRDDRRQVDEEDFNLLYVGITRAKRVLLLSAAGNDRSDRSDLKESQKKWFEKIKDHCDAWDPSAEPLPSVASPVPTWRSLHAPTTVTPVAVRVATETLAMRQGKALHRLLELGARLPDALAARAIAEFALPTSAREAVLHAAQTIVDSPIASIVFDPDRLAYAEAEWPTRFPGMPAIMRPDRIVRVETTPETWWIIDFKWAVLDSELADYAQQLAGYVQEFQAIRPQATICAKILTAKAHEWRLMEGRLVHFA